MEGGIHEARGKSGEKGALQFLPNTWEIWSKEVAGGELAFTQINEEYVALMMVQKWINIGMSDRQIFWMWNSGRSDRCIEGTNKYGVKYSSCQYAHRALAYIIK